MLTTQVPVLERAVDRSRNLERQFQVHCIGARTQIATWLIAFCAPQQNPHVLTAGISEHTSEIRAVHGWASFRDELCQWCRLGLAVKPHACPCHRDGRGRMIAEHNC